MKIFLKQRKNTNEIEDQNIEISKKTKKKKMNLK